MPPKEKGPTTIAFATAKGGVGKSTAAVLFSSYLYYDRDHRIVVVDADSPQHSLQDLRNAEKRILERDLEFRKRFLRSGKQKIYPIIATELAAVLTRPEPNRPSCLELARSPQVDAEFLIVDTPGSIAAEGLVAVLANVDFLVVPLEPEQMSLSSTVRFIAALARSLPQPPDGPRVIAFWNKITLQSHAAVMDAQSAAVAGLGVRVLTNYIPYSVKVKRDDTRSTVLPVNFATLALLPFAEELYNAVNAKA